MVGSPCRFASIHSPIFENLSSWTFLSKIFWGKSPQLKIKNVFFSLLKQVDLNVGLTPSRSGRSFKVLQFAGNV